MAFDPVTTLTPVSIGRLVIDLADDGPQVNEFAEFRIEIVYDDGSSKWVGGDLIPHLIPADIATARAFMATMRAKAENEILP